MNVRSSFHKTVDRVFTSPRIQTGNKGTYLRSIIGPTDAMGRVIRQLLDREYDLGQVLAIGAGLDEDGPCLLHMLLLDLDPGVNLVTGRACVTYEILDANRQTGFDYANQLGTMALSDGGRIQVATWGNGFQTLSQQDAQDVFDLIFSDLFDKNGRVKGVKGPDIRTMLLIGTEVERITVVSMPGDNFHALPETGFGEQERHLMLKDSLIVAELGHQRIVGLKAQSIANFLRDTSKDIVWRQARLPYGQILELAVVDEAKHSTVITLARSDYAYLPACFRLNGEGLEIKTSVASATTVGMIGRNFDPIVRISPVIGGNHLTVSPRFAAVTVDQNKSCDFVLGFKPSTDLPTRFAITAQTAASDELYEHAS